MKKIFKVAIIDDDEVARENLQFELQSFSKFRIDGIAKNGNAGKKLIFKCMPDLLFLDVELPDMKGMELMQAIRKDISWNMKVIFYTAYDRYLREAIRESAFDYLTKPIDKKELAEMLDRFIGETKENRAKVPVDIQIKSNAPLENTLILSSHTNDFSFIRPENIGYFKYNSDKKQWEVFLNYSIIPVSIKKGIKAESILKSAACFIQIHQSYIINLNYLVMIKDKRCVLYPPFDHETELQVSKIYLKKLQERFFLF